LHFEDIRKLLLVLQGLVDKGNTVIVIEHNLDVIKTADWVVDLGPEGGSGGGLLVAEGTPEEVAAIPESHTGRFLADLLEVSNPKAIEGRGSAIKAAKAKAVAATSAPVKAITKAAPAKRGAAKAAPVKAAAKAAAAKTTVAKQAAAKTTVAKQAAAKTTVAKTTVAKTTVAKTTVAKQAVAKTTVAKTAATKTAVAKKAAGKPVTTQAGGRAAKRTISLDTAGSATARRR
jgi:excinuclease ABC subunit A